MLVDMNSTKFMGKTTFKIGVLSDTHLTAPDDGIRALARTHFAETDLILHAGDLVDLSVLDAFAGREVRAVCGNMDGPRVRQVLPEQLVLDISGFRIAVIHGWGSPDELEQRIAQKLNDVDCIVYGHSHYPANRIINGVLFFNPGSATDRRFAKSRSVGLLEIASGITGTIMDLEK